MFTDKWIVLEVTYNERSRGHYQVMRNDHLQRKNTNYQFPLTPEGLISARLLRDSKNGDTASFRIIM